MPQSTTWQICYASPLGQFGWKPTHKVATTSALKFSTYAPRGSDGKFKPRDRATKGKSRDTASRPTRLTGVVEKTNSSVPEDLSPDYVYVNGLYELGTFAWPTQAPEGLALALVGTSGTEVPEEWKDWCPTACCTVCETVQKTTVCTKPDF